MKETIKNSDHFPSTRVEKFSDTLANDFSTAVNWAKENPYKAAGLGVFALFALRNKAVRGLLGSAAIAFFSTKATDAVEHSLH